MSDPIFVKPIPVVTTKDLEDFKKSTTIKNVCDTQSTGNPPRRLIEVVLIFAE